MNIEVVDENNKTDENNGEKVISLNINQYDFTAISSNWSKILIL